LLERNVFIDEAEPFGQHQNCLSSCKKKIDQTQFIVKWRNIKDGQTHSQLAKPLNASAHYQRLHSFTSAWWLITLSGMIFSLKQP